MSNSSDELARSERLLEHIFDNSETRLYVKEVLKESDGSYSFPFVKLNKMQIETLEKKTREEVLGKTDFDMFAPESAEKTYQDEIRLVETKSPLITEEVLLSKSGVRHIFKVRKKIVQLDNKTYIWGETRDITREFAYEEELKRLARQDTLIKGFYNRTYGTLKIEDALTNTRINASCALLITDLDRFKFLNDTYGHQVGDEAIRITGQRIQHTLRTGDRGNDIPVRLGGDEFCLFIANLPPEREEAEKALGMICERLLDIVKSAFSVNGQSISTTTSIGACLMSPDKRKKSEFEDIYNIADKAMYQVKKTQRGRYVINHL